MGSGLAITHLPTWTAPNETHRGSYGYPMVHNLGEPLPILPISRMEQPGWTDHMAGAYFPPCTSARPTPILLMTRGRDSTSDRLFENSQLSVR